MEKVKEEKGVRLDTELGVEDLQKLVKLFKSAVKDFTGKDFPDSAWEQLWGGICAVFDSWMNERAILYRRMNQIPEEWGTAVNVQAMVYGNMGENSATGVAFLFSRRRSMAIFTMAAPVRLPLRVCSIHSLPS